MRQEGVVNHYERHPVSCCRTQTTQRTRSAVLAMVVSNKRRWLNRCMSGITDVSIGRERQNVIDHNGLMIFPEEWVCVWNTKIGHPFPDIMEDSIERKFEGCDRMKKRVRQVVDSAHSVAPIEQRIENQFGSPVRLWSTKSTVSVNGLARSMLSGVTYARRDDR